MSRGIVKIADLKLDDLNTNKGTAEGRKAVEQSLVKYGAGRSILVDRDGRVIAGNKTLTSSGVLPSDEVVVVPSDGTKLVVVQRTDLSLDDPKGRSLAIADNRSSEIGLEWDAANLKALDPVVDLKEFFSDKDLKKIFNEPGESNAALPEGYGVMIENLSEQQQLDLLERLSAEGYTVKALTF
jgi:hypothetical protein